MESSLANLAIGSEPSAESLSGQTVEAGYGVAVDSDLALFASSLEKSQISRTTDPSAVATALFSPLDFINSEAQELVEYAESAVASGNELTPSEIVALTARSQEFMFHAQLTANVANRTADGMQQLFRQQS